MSIFITAAVTWSRKAATKTASASRSKDFQRLRYRGSYRGREGRGDRKVTRSHFAEGPLRLETTSVGNRKEHEREYAASGQAVRESRWLDGRLSEETQWYLNGNAKSKTRWQRDGAQVLVGAEEFWDSGLIRARTVRDERVGYLGVQQGFDEPAYWLLTSRTKRAC